MHVQKMITVPQEIYLKLQQEDNASRLISHLLYLHYRTAEITTLSEEEIRRRIKILEIKEEADERIKELEAEAAHARNS